MLKLSPFYLSLNSLFSQPLTSNEPTSLTIVIAPNPYSIHIKFVPFNKPVLFFQNEICLFNASLLMKITVIVLFVIFKIYMCYLSFLTISTGIYSLPAPIVKAPPWNHTITGFSASLFSKYYFDRLKNKFISFKNQFLKIIIKIRFFYRIFEGNFLEMFFFPCKILCNQSRSFVK